MPGCAGGVNKLLYTMIPENPTEDSLKYTLMEVLPPVSEPLFVLPMADIIDIWYPPAGYYRGRCYPRHIFEDAIRLELENVSERTLNWWGRSLPKGKSKLELLAEARLERINRRQEKLRLKRKVKCE